MIYCLGYQQRSVGQDGSKADCYVDDFCPVFPGVLQKPGCKRT